MRRERPEEPERMGARIAEGRAVAVVYGGDHAERAGPRGVGGGGMREPRDDHVGGRRRREPSAAEGRARRARGERWKCRWRHGAGGRGGGEGRPAEEGRASAMTRTVHGPGDPTKAPPNSVSKSICKPRDQMEWGGWKTLRARRPNCSVRAVFVPKMAVDRKYSVVGTASVR